MSSSALYGETNLGYEGYGPWRYRKLSEPELTSLLTRLADPKSIAGVDCVSFQPATGEAPINQDRYAFEDWDLEGGIWKFLAIFDGHAGHETVNHVVVTLPGLLKSTLASSLSQGSGSPLSISEVLKDTISAYDDALTKDLFDIFPGGVDEISRLSDEEIDKIVNDSEQGGSNWAKVLRCMHGSTVLISLIDPSKENIWVASLGDCQAALGTFKGTESWNPLILSTDHNAKADAEVARIREEHPGESECILNDRVLGAIAVTRAVGDHEFKIAVPWTTRVFKNAKPTFKFSATTINLLTPRIITPPYLSNIAEVQHLNLKAHYPESQGQESFLVMCSDGLVDMYRARELSELKQASDLWMNSASAKNSQVYGDHTIYENRALRVLRKGLGDTEVETVAAWLTAETGGKWMDDVTVLVLPL